MAIGVCCAVLFGQHGLYNGHPWTQDVHSLYLTLSRTAWGVGICWIIFACCSGYGGVVNQFLSARAWIPLGRMTYCAYLVHIPVMMSYYYSRQQPFYFTTTQYIFLFIGSLVFGVYCGDVCHFIF